jgi:hypothetical protein
LSASVDERFNQVDVALVEQRRYTEFAYERLDAKMGAGFAQFDAKMDAGFARLDAKIGADFTQLDGKMEAGFAQFDAKMDAGFARLERKLDQFIDTQSKTNELSDRRPRALESASGQA